MVHGLGKVVLWTWNAVPVGVYVAGTAWDALPGQSGTGSPYAFVRKYDAAGNELWSQQFSSGEGDLVAGVVADTSGVYVAGWTLGALPGQSNVGSNYVFVRKYDATVRELWTRQFGSAEGDGASSRPNWWYSARRK